MVKAVFCCQLAFKLKKHKKTIIDTTVILFLIVYQFSGFMHLSQLPKITDTNYRYRVAISAIRNAHQNNNTGSIRGQFQRAIYPKNDHGHKNIGPLSKPLIIVFAFVLAEILSLSKITRTKAYTWNLVTSSAQPYLRLGTIRI